MSLHFRSRDEASRFIESAGHRVALAAYTALQVAVLGEQPRAVALAVRRTIEPGVDVSTVMPTSQAIRRRTSGTSSR